MKKIISLSIYLAIFMGLNVSAQDITLRQDLVPEQLVSSKNVTTDILLSQGEVTQDTGEYSIILIPNEKTKNAIHSFAVRWVESNAKLKAIQEKKNNKEALTDNEAKFLRTLKGDRGYSEWFAHHLKNRIEGMKRAHNWNGEHKDSRQYNYEYHPSYSEESGYTNSYAWNVLHQTELDIDKNLSELVKQNGRNFTTEEVEQAILTPLAKMDQLVKNDELRFYLNDVVWFASMQSVKEMYFDEGVVNTSKEKPYAPGII